MRTILCALLAAGLLAGCGGGDDEPDPAARETSTPAATQGAEDAEAEIRETFDDYNEALVERDFDDACEQLAPETSEKLRENVKTLGVTDPPQECADLLALIYERVDKVPDQKKLLEEIASSAKIDRVTVKGDTATIKWTASANGQNTSIEQTARRIGDEWKLIDVTN
jgi:hypothetical protein